VSAPFPLNAAVLVVMVAQLEMPLSMHSFQASRIGYDRNSLRSPYLASRAGVRRLRPGQLRHYLKFRYIRFMQK